MLQCLKKIYKNQRGVQNTVEHLQQRFFAKIASFSRWTVLQKSSILDVQLDSKNVSERFCNVFIAMAPIVYKIVTHTLRILVNISWILLNHILMQLAIFFYQECYVSFYYKMEQIQHIYLIDLHNILRCFFNISIFPSFLIQESVG